MLENHIQYKLKYKIDDESRLTNYSKIDITQFDIYSDCL